MRLSIVFITVDPERDGAGRSRQLRQAVRRAGRRPDRHARPQIEQVKKQFGIYSRKVQQPGGSYSVDHTAAVILMDRNGQFVATLSPEEGDAVALDKLKRISA